MSLADLDYRKAVKNFGRNPNSGGNFAQGQPVGILLHYTAGGAAAERLAGRGGSNVSAHFTVDRDGKVYQCGALNQRLWHAGVSHWKGLTGLNSYFIGIEQANFGFWRIERGLPDKATAEREWFKAAHKNDPSRVMLWEPYPDELIESSLDICRFLLENIKSIKMICGHDDVSPGRKSDPGPAFPMNRFKDLLSPLDETKPPRYKVVVAKDDTLNVRNFPDSNSAKKEDWGPLQSGEIVEYLRESGAWYLIRNKDKKEGWAHSLYLRRV